MQSTTDDTQEYQVEKIERLQPPIPHSSIVQVDVAGRSHCGKVRANNEDHFLVVRLGRFFESLESNLPSDLLPSRFVDDAYGMVVADGVGGHAAGEHASRLAISTLVNLVLSTPDWILRADDPAQADEILHRASERFQKVRDALKSEAAGNPSLAGFGTTLTLAASMGRELFVANTGDSRAYVLHQNKMLQLTRDHTFAEELHKAGIITRAEAATHRLRHVLTRCLGTTLEPTPDVRKLSLEDGDRVLLCSDGLTEMVETDVIASLLAESGTSEELCHRMIDEALKAGGQDNVTVIIAQYRIRDNAPPVASA